MSAALKTLWEHAGLAFWAMGIFFVGFALSFAVVKWHIQSLLAFPRFMLRLMKHYVTPRTPAVGLLGFIFLFNSIAIFIYMMSGGLVLLPLLFDLLTGLNVGVIMLIDTRGRTVEIPEQSPPGGLANFLTIFVLVVELTSFWLAIAMGMRMGQMLRVDFSWTNYLELARPRAVAYVMFIVPALFVSALAETVAIKKIGRR